MRVPAAAGRSGPAAAGAEVPGERAAAAGPSSGIGARAGRRDVVQQAAGFFPLLPLSGLAVTKSPDRPTPALPAFPPPAPECTGGGGGGGGGAFPVCHGTAGSCWKLPHQLPSTSVQS